MLEDYGELMFLQILLSPPNYRLLADQAIRWLHSGMRESAIIDLSQFETAAFERRFMLAFLEALYRRSTGEPVCGVPRVTMSVTSVVQSRSAVVATPPAARAIRPPIECPTSAIRRTAISCGPEAPYPG